MTSLTARQLISTSLIWDNHACMPLRPADESFLPQLARHRQAGFGVVSLNVGFGEQGIEEHIRMLAHFRRWLARHDDDYAMVQTVADIEKARRDGKMAVMFDIEGMNAVADQPSMVQLYYDLGVRWMLVAYNRHNRAGGGCQEDDDPGLSQFGRRIVDEMARVGMVACCSHSGHRTAMDLMAYSSRPVIFSHSNPYAVHPHPRNVRDEALKACALTEGVVGLNGIGIFVSYQADLVESFTRHIDYLVQLIGPDHVGLGFDFVFDATELDDMTSDDPALFPPELGYGRGMRMIPPESLEEIVNRLQRLGYSDADLRAILGGNFLRVARMVWLETDRAN